MSDLNLFVFIVGEIKYFRFREKCPLPIPFPSFLISPRSNHYPEADVYHAQSCFYIFYYVWLGAGEGDDRGWDGWMASWTRWTWVWVNSGSWWWTGRPGVLQSMGSQRVGHDWATELNYVCIYWSITYCFLFLDFIWMIPSSMNYSAVFSLNAIFWDLWL